MEVERKIRCRRLMLRVEVVTPSNAPKPKSERETASRPQLPHCDLHSPSQDNADPANHTPRLTTTTEEDSSNRHCTISLYLLLSFLKNRIHHLRTGIHSHTARRTSKHRSLHTTITNTNVDAITPTRFPSYPPLLPPLPPQPRRRYPSPPRDATNGAAKRSRQWPGGHSLSSMYAFPAPSISQSSFLSLTHSQSKRAIQSKTKNSHE